MLLENNPINAVRKQWQKPDMPISRHTDEQN